MSSAYSAIVSGKSISTKPRMPLTKNWAAKPTSSRETIVFMTGAPAGAGASRRSANDPGRMRRHQGQKTATAMI